MIQQVLEQRGIAVRGHCLELVVKVLPIAAWPLGRIEFTWCRYGSHSVKPAGN
jgi:hypothetical protein